MISPGYATRVALRELGRRAMFLDGQLERLNELIVLLVTARALGMLALYGIDRVEYRGADAHRGERPPGRLRSEAAYLCAVTPSPHRQGKSPAIGSTRAATGWPTMPCGGSCSPA